MSTTLDLVGALKAELRSAGLTYAELASRLGIAESSVKRMFARGDMPLSRVDEICRVLKLDFSDVARRVTDAPSARFELTLAQEKAVVADLRLLLMAICCLSQWTLEQVVSSYHYTEAEAVRYLAQLDRLGIVELKPMNRYRLKVSHAFRWRADGPVMAYFREHVVNDYFAGGFDGEGELLTLVHGSVNHGAAPVFNERLQRLAQDFARQHLADQKLPESQRTAFTLLLGMRSWWFSAFSHLRRPKAAGNTDR